jgi:hypothetical protein
MNKQTTKGSPQTPINSPTPSYLQPRPFAVQAQADTTTQGVEKPELQSEEEKVQRSRIDLMEVMMAASSPSDPPNRLQAQAETPTQMVRKPELQSNGKKVQRSRIDLMEIMMAASSPNVQAKLEIGEVGDKYEQEADRVASQVVSQINNPVQKKLQRLSESKVIQRKEAIAGGTASADLESSIQSARGSGQSLDANLQQSMGQAMGADFSEVKVHTDSQSDQLNKSIQAKAFTTGQDVFFRQGAYEPSSRGGQELIAHELTHVVQQNGGVVQRSPLKNIKKTSENGAVVQREDAKVFSQEGATKHDTVQNDPSAKSWKFGQDTPEIHPLYPKFKSRIDLINSTHPANNDAVSHDEGLGVWTQILSVVNANKEASLQKDASGWVDLSHPQFTEAMNCLDAAVFELSNLASSQFTKANSFGFWSEPEGKKMAEEKAELTLGTSGIGTLLEGLGSLVGEGWVDRILWGALSRGYAEMVAMEMETGEKRVEVYAGGKLTSAMGNVFKAIESKALQKGIEGVGKTMEQCVTYISVARKTKNDPSIDYDGVQMPGLPPGVWAKGPDRDAVLAEGNRCFALLPEA